MAYVGFTIPDLVDAPFSSQAKVASEDWQIVADGLRGNGVQAGCVVAQRAAGANMSVDVSAGTINREGTAIAVAGGNLVIAAADGTNPRIDIVHVNNAGTKAVTTGTPSSAPAPPAIPQVAGINNIVLAFVYVPAGDTTINTTQIVDKRALVNAPGGGAGTGTVTTSGTPATGNLTQFSGSTVITNGNLSGDVTTAGTLAATIAANAVSYAKIQDVTAASRLLGRGSAAGAGDPQEITLGANLTMTGTTLAASGGTGTTPTGTGFTHITGGTQDAAAKLVDTADINNAQVTFAKVQNVSAASRLVGRGSAGGAGSPEEIILGANLTMTGTTLAASAGTGGDFSSNTAVSVDSEVVLFSSTLGKTGKRATGTGVARLASGVLSSAELSGDVTTTGSNAATIAGNAVTYAKMQDVAAASRLLGRGSAAGAGDPQEITLGTNLTMAGTVLNASGSGTTPTGTGFTHITAGAEDAAAKLVDTADVNNAQITYGKIQNVSAASRLLGRGSAGGAGSAEELTLGTNLTMSGTTINASGSGGSVTVRKNTGADVGTRPRLNFVEGSNVTLTVADDAGGNEVDITIAAAAGSSSATVAIVAADVVNAVNNLALTNITGLTFNTTASATEMWHVEVFLATFCNTAGGSTVKFKIGWSVSGAQDIRWGGNSETGSTASPQVTAIVTAGNLIYSSGANIDGIIRLIARVRSNGAAGAVQLRFAQNVTGGAGSQLTIRADSYLIAQKVRA